LRFRYHCWPRALQVLEDGVLREHTQDGRGVRVLAKEHGASLKIVCKQR
jgi:hypothetical protein